LSPKPEPRPTLEEMTCRYVLRILEQAKGNKSEAARILGVPRRTLYRMLERYSDAGKPSDLGRADASVH
jgi:two-component system response regulator HydG